MALLVCEDCTAKYSVGAKKCPECGSTERHEDGEQVAKPTQADLKPAWVDYAVTQGLDREAAEAMTKADLIVLLTDGQQDG